MVVGLDGFREFALGKSHFKYVSTGWSNVGVNSRYPLRGERRRGTFFDVFGATFI